MASSPAGMAARAIAAMCLAAALLGCAGKPQNNTGQNGQPQVTESASADGLSNAEREALTEAVRRQLRDPDSAELRWPAVPPGKRRSTTVLAYCGLVSAKTPGGAMTGFRPYYAIVVTEQSGTAVADVISPPPDSGVDRSAAARLACTEAGYKLD